MLKPDYPGKCITKMVPTVKHILGLDEEETLVDERSNKVLLVVIDGLGYEKLMGLAEDDEKLKEILGSFNLQRMTTCFPTSTVSGLFSILSGKPPGEHGLFDWVSYSKDLEMRYYPLPFEAVDDEDQEEFEEKAKKEDIQPETIPESLPGEVKKYEIQPGDIVDEETERKKAYENIVEGLVKTRKAVENEDGKSFFYLYIGALDKSSHENGPDEKESEELVKELFRLMKENIIEGLDDLTVIVTSDHGFMDIENSVDIREGSKLAERIYPHLKEQNGRKIKPVGGPRAVNLHVKDDKVEEVMDILNEELDADLELFKTETMLEEGFFGQGEISEEFAENLGNLTLVMTGNSIITFEPYDDYYEGMHGGLTEEELYVPLLSKKL